MKKWVSQSPHGLAGLLVAKGVLALGEITIDEPGVVLEPVTTFENFDQQLAASQKPRSSEDQGLSDILTGGAISALRAGANQNKKKEDS